MCASRVIIGNPYNGYINRWVYDHPSPTIWKYSRVQTLAHTDILLVEILPTVSTIRVLYILGGAGILPLDGLSLENQLRKVALSNWEAFLHLFKRLLFCSLSWRKSLLWLFELCQKIRFSTTPGLVPTMKSPVCTITSHMEKTTQKKRPLHLQPVRNNEDWRFHMLQFSWLKETESYPFIQSSWSPGIDKKVLFESWDPSDETTPSSWVIDVLYIFSSDYLF